MPPKRFVKLPQLSSISRLASPLQEKLSEAKRAYLGKRYFPPLSPRVRAFRRSRHELHNL